MIELRVSVDPAVVATMRGLVEAAAQHGPPAPTARPPEAPPPPFNEPPPDPDEEVEMAAAWQEHVYAQAKEDLRELIELLGPTALTTGELRLTEAQAEAVVRACSAVRLKLRETVLGSLPDSALEYGQVKLGRLARDQRLGYGCYVFLASLQTVLVAELDPAADAVDGGEMPDRPSP